MEASDIYRRIARLYAALGAVYSDNFEGVTVEISGFDSNGAPKFSINAQGDYSQGDLEHIAGSSIHAVANFFEHCLAACKKLGIPEPAMFKVTEGSLSLRILRDLDNKDKHPKNASGINTSGVFPELIAVQRMIVFAPSKDSPGILKFTFVVGSKEISVLDRRRVDAVITGQIRNAKTGAALMPLHLLLEDGVSQWEKFLLGHRADISLTFLAIAEKMWPPP
jgi:hypothetical protein